MKHHHEYGIIKKSKYLYIGNYLGPALIFTGRYINSITHGIGKCNNFEVWVRLRDLFQPFIACPAGLQWIHILRTSADKIKHVRDGRGGY